MKPRVLNSAKKEIYEPLKLLALEMRRNSTQAEAILWTGLERKQLGVKFRRQHIIDKFIVDFYCIEKNLVIEVDGKVHDNQKEQDAERAQCLMELGCSIMRYNNDEVISDLEKVLTKIKEYLNNNCIKVPQQF